MKTVVLIEDEGCLREILRDLVCLALKDTGIPHNILTFPTAEAAIDHFSESEGPPDLIISDIDTKSRLNGLDLLFFVREDLGWQTPFTLFSGSICDKTRDTARCLNAECVLKGMRISFTQLREQTRLAMCA